jgi:hypothetical protein
LEVGGGGGLPGVVLVVGILVDLVVGGGGELPGVVLVVGILVDLVVGGGPPGVVLVVHGEVVSVL